MRRREEDNNNLLSFVQLFRKYRKLCGRLITFKFIFIRQVQERLLIADDKISKFLRLSAAGHGTGLAASRAWQLM